METALLVLMIGLLCGTALTFFFIFKYIFECNKIMNDFFQRTMLEMEKKLCDKVIEFEEVTKLASKANTSLGERVAEYDKKMVDIESRVSMLRMQR